MSTMLRCLMVGCLTVVCGCAVQQGGRGEKSGVAAQETRYAGFASQLGEQMRPYVSGLRMLCRRATLTDPHREMTVAVCRRPSEEWTLVEPIFEPLPR